MIVNRAKVKIGVHVEKDSVVSVSKELMSVGCNAIQIYLSNRISFSPGKPLSNQEVVALNQLRSENLYIAVHGKLILNFCGDDARSIPALICDMIEADRIGADVVLHQGKNVKGLSKEEALTRYVMNLQEVLDQTVNLNNRILLENSCQQGTELGYHLDDLVTIWRLLGAAGTDKRDRNYQDRIGFCLDLCHAHVGGMINMRDVDNVTKVMDEFDKKIGLGNMKLIHFNDSEIKFDGHNDSHSDILMGFIGNPDMGGNSLGFRKIVDYAKLYDIPMVMETPGMIPIQLQLALVQGWAGLGPDIENEYLESTEKIRDGFKDNPKSRKGRKATPSAAKTVATVATAATAATTSKTQVNIGPKIPVKITATTTVAKAPKIPLRIRLPVRCVESGCPEPGGPELGVGPMVDTTIPKIQEATTTLVATTTSQTSNPNANVSVKPRVQLKIIRRPVFTKTSETSEISKTSRTVGTLTSEPNANAVCLPVGIKSSILESIENKCTVCYGKGGDSDEC